MKSNAGLLLSHQCRYNHKDICLSTLLQSWNRNGFNFEAALTVTDLIVIIFPFLRLQLFPQNYSLTLGIDSWQNIAFYELLSNA